MKKLFLFCLLTVFITSCKKDPQTNNLQLDAQQPTVKDTITSTIATNTVVVSAQTFSITYKDWIPDSTLNPNSNNPYNKVMLIDVDFDNIIDIRFSVYSTYAGSTPSSGNYYNRFAVINSLDTNILISFGTALSYNNIVNFIFTDTINEVVSWRQSYTIKGLVPFYSGPVGCWDSGSNCGYAAIKIKSSSGTKYGWLNLDVSTSSIKIKAQAINNNYNQFIKVGQTQ